MKPLVIELFAAAIARIPFELARHIARCYKPKED